MSDAYEPGTMIGRAAFAVWRQAGKEETPLQDAQRIIRSLRSADMGVLKHAVGDLGIDPAIALVFWSQMIDAVLAQAPIEERSLAEFSARRKAKG